jgi:hypothetical protein
MNLNNISTRQAGLGCQHRLKRRGGGCGAEQETPMFVALPVRRQASWAGVSTPSATMWKFISWHMLTIGLVSGA